MLGTVVNQSVLDPSVEFETFEKYGAKKSKLSVEHWLKREKQRLFVTAIHQW